MSHVGMVRTLDMVLHYQDGVARMIEELEKYTDSEWDEVLMEGQESPGEPDFIIEEEH